MTPDTPFQALVVTEQADGTFTRAIETRTIGDLALSALLIRVQYSSLNYKDALSASGNKGVTRTFPHTPGIDAAGVVVESDSDDFVVGDEVVVIGYDLGMNTAGGYGEYIRVPASWAVKMPASLTPRQSMIYGTAGFTAGMSVARIVEHGIKPTDGEILVTGATGGVGSVAVALLAKLGYNVVAATGKGDQHDWLRELGATSIVGRDEINDDSRRSMLRERWAGVVDTVGGNMLTTALKAAKYGSAVTCCGLVASPKLESSIFPFILRGVTLYGIDSVECARQVRLQIWDRLATEWKLDNLDSLATERTLAELPAEIAKILQGEQVGRVVVKL
jgi:putative YhdH/YhfP family quinone oxidoreductase